MNLTIDIGNTNAKYALFNKNTIAETGAIPTQTTVATLKKLLADNPVSNIAVSSVSNTTTIQEAIKSLTHIKPTTLTHLSPLPFDNLYTTPHTLGTDRLAALLGAVSIKPEQNFLVIDIGTCITYDLLYNGQYLGGNIVPGYTIRTKSLNMLTAKLPHITIEPTDKLIGNSTAQAINCGVYWGCIYDINGTIEKIQSCYKNIETIITGGGFNLLKRDINPSAQYFPHLVHQGLNHLINIETSR